jgi:hypothetical protein
MVWTSSIAPSVVARYACASAAFRTAWFKPWISPAILLVMNNPAASSAPEFIRFPEDRRAIEFSMLLFTLYELCEEFSAPIFVFMLSIVILVTPFTVYYYTNSLHLDKRQDEFLFRKNKKAPQISLRGFLG